LELLSFSTGLTNELDKGSTNAVFLLRLYYGNESSYTGLSTIDYDDGGDNYYGAIISMGDFSQKLDFFGFKGATNSFSVSMVNTEIFNGKRFSDLVGTNDYDNRKWEVYVVAGSATKYLIGTGKISANFEYDNNKISIRLNDFSTGIDTSLPRTIIRENDTTNNFQFAPEANFNKPIPMLFGDHSHTALYDSGVLSESTERWATRSKVPAIIVNAYDTTTGKVIAKADTETMSGLNVLTTYYNRGDIPSAINSASSNVVIDDSVAKISFSGVSAYALITLNMDNSVDSSYTKDKFSKTVETRASSGTAFTFGVPEVPKLGTMVASSPMRLFLIGSVDDVLQVQYEVDVAPYGSPTTSTTTGTHSATGRLFLGGTSVGADVTSGWGADDRANWNLQAQIKMIILGGTSANITIDQAWLQIEYNSDDTVTKHKYIEREFIDRDPYDAYDRGEMRIVSTTQRVDIPQETQVIYVSGKGREFTSAMTSESRSHGFATGALIEHPIFIIENILRVELGLSDTNIDTGNFDSIYALTTSYKSAFSQDSSVNAIDLIDDICKQFCLYFFFDSLGKFRFLNLKLATAYTTATFNIDFADMTFNGVSKTPLNQIKTSINLEYDYDYISGKNRLSEQSSTVTDSDFNLNKPNTMTVDGNKIRYDVEASSDANARALANTILDLYEDIHQSRRNILSITCLKPKYLKAEIGDLVSIDNAPSDVKIYGTALSSQIFMIVNISKKINKVTLKLIQVN
jgi:hypothetical protein